MADKVNIKNLSTADEIKSGQYLIVETSDGTKILDYKDFIIGQENITFQPLLSSHTTEITDLSSNQGSLSSEIVNFRTVVADVSALSGIQWKGEYSTLKEYKKPDAVYSGSSSFIAIADVPTGSNYSPLDSDNVIRSTYWEYLAKGGVPTLVTQGAVLQGTGTGAQELAPGSSGYVLKSQGSGANLTWATPGNTIPTCKSLPEIGGGRNGVQLNFFYLMNDGTVTSTGESYAGLGYHSNASSDYGASRPTRVMMPADYDWTTKTITAISMQSRSCWLLDNDGVVYCVGQNDDGQLGTNDTSERYVFEKIFKYWSPNEGPDVYHTHDEVHIEKIVAVDDNGHVGNVTYFITKNLGSAPNDGRIYACGNNQAGQLGSGSISTYITKPGRVGTLTDVNPDKFWAQGGTETTVFAVTNDGKFWGWGDYSHGNSNRRGDAADSSDTANNVDKSTPSQQNASSFTPGDATSTALHGVDKMVICHTYHAGVGTTFALLSTGHVYACGRGSNGQMGNGTTTGNNYSWTLVPTVSAAIDITGAITSHGSLIATCSAIEGGSFNQTTLKYEGFTDLSEVGGRYYDTVTSSKGRKMLAWGYQPSYHFGALGTGVGTTGVHTPIDLSNDSNVPTQLQPAMSGVFVDANSPYQTWTFMIDLSGHTWFAGQEDYGKSGRGSALWPTGVDTGHGVRNTFMRTSLPVDWNDVKEFKFVHPESAANTTYGATMILTYDGRVFVTGYNPARWAGATMVTNANNDDAHGEAQWLDVSF